MNKLAKRTIPLLLLIALLLCGCGNEVRSGFVPVSGGGRIYYEEKGEGEPLILLHGHSLDTRMWDLQFDEFAQHYRVVRLDFRGYGRSSKQSETFQFTHLDDLLTLMDGLHIDKAHIVGLSMGSFVAGDMLAMAPERMLSCVMASGGIRSVQGPSEPMGPEESARRDKEIAELNAKGIDIYKREWLEALVSGGGSRREEMREPLWQMINDWDAWQPLHKEVRMFWAREAWKRLEEVRPLVPTLMIRGETETKGKPYTPKELQFLPNGVALSLPDCGHMMNMEQPEAFNRAVLRFIEEI
ncbi:MAG: alpha/beta hydrolase [Bacteroides sp.]|nr:alpha/beta hydrolase [Bacteroides sp.]